MRTRKDFLKRIKEYKGISYIYIKDVGYLAWQMGTGDNVEIMFIEVAEPRKYRGTQLIRCMLKSVKPFHSIYVVRLGSNKNAGKFYRSLGFKEHKVTGLYKVPAVLGTVSYKKLCKNLSIN